MQNQWMGAAAEIEREIRASFPAKRPLAFASITDGSLREEPLLTAKAFSDKDDWTKLDFKWLDGAPDGWGTALTFMSSEAICYYIPAYIIADLHGTLDRAEPYWHLTYGFSDWPDNSSVNWTEYSRKRWSHLSKAQARAVVHYLEWLVSRDEPGVHQASSQALRSFWYRRAADE